MTNAERDALGAICLLAAFADGSPDDLERERIKSTCRTLGAEAGLADDVYERVIFKKTGVAQEAQALGTPELREQAYELAVGVCDADGKTNDAERAFLDDLARTLNIPAGEAKNVREQVDLLADTPVSTPVPAAVMAPVPPMPAAAASAPNAKDQEINGTIRNHAILCGALELLPQGLASAAIIPIQMKMVYSIGKQHGYSLDRGHITEFLGAIGVGMTSQVVESYARRLMGGLVESVAGRFIGKGMASTLGGFTRTGTGAAMTFATTYALGQVAKQYYAGGRKLAAIDLRRLFAGQLESAKTMYEQNKPLIEQQAKKLNPAQLLTMIRG
jgi:uncharacterized protein (DUF697 family)/tellurite resistance protein